MEFVWFLKKTQLC